MRTNLKRLALAVCALTFWCGIAGAADNSQHDWHALVKHRLTLYGHRNWIVIADSAYPDQSADGIETVVSNADQLQVVKEVVADIAASKHVRAIVHTDSELKLLTESEAPGVSAYRQQLFGLLSGAQIDAQPHLENIHNLDAVSKTFRVLIIKTTMTVPYTTVFLQLDCAYWTSDAEQRFRARLAH